MWRNGLTYFVLSNILRNMLGCSTRSPESRLPDRDPTPNHAQAISPLLKYITFLEMVIPCSALWNKAVATDWDHRRYNQTEVVWSEIFTAVAINTPYFGIYKPSSYLSGNTLSLRYRPQPITAMKDLMFSRRWLWKIEPSWYLTGNILRLCYRPQNHWKFSNLSDKSYGYPLCLLQKFSI
jgi:hypothetical protein